MLSSVKVLGVFLVLAAVAYALDDAESSLGGAVELVSDAEQALAVTTGPTAAEHRRLKVMNRRRNLSDVASRQLDATSTTRGGETVLDAGSETFILASEAAFWWLLGLREECGKYDWSDPDSPPSFVVNSMKSQVLGGEKLTIEADIEGPADSGPTKYTIVMYENVNLLMHSEGDPESDNDESNWAFAYELLDYSPKFCTTPSVCVQNKVQDAKFSFVDMPATSEIDFTQSRETASEFEGDIDADPSCPGGKSRLLADSGMIELNLPRNTPKTPVDGHALLRSNRTFPEHPVGLVDHVESKVKGRKVFEEIRATRYQVGRQRPERTAAERAKDLKTAKEIADKLDARRRTADLPKEYDWRTKYPKCTKSIRAYNQGACG